eukprot:1055746-Amphidinium_carterae.2
MLDSLGKINAHFGFACCLFCISFRQYRLGRDEEDACDGLPAFHASLQRLSPGYIGAHRCTQSVPISQHKNCSCLHESENNPSRLADVCPNRTCLVNCGLHREPWEAEGPHVGALAA